MKKFYLLLLLAICALISACSANDKNLGNENIDSLSDSMPEPFNWVENAGGDALRNYYNMYEIEFTNFPIGILELVSEESRDIWIDSFKFGKRDLNEATILNFINEFNIPKETLVETVTKEGFYIEDFTISAKDVDIIYSNDDYLIKSYFVNNFSLFYNGEIYTPEWFYTHTSDDYVKENLPPDEVLAAFEKFKDIPFTDEARKALDEKLTSYSGKTDE